jgi:hypothetical protein
MRWKRAAGWATVALIVVALLWFGGVGLWASRRCAEADRGWAASFGSLEDFRKKYPTVETNAAARRVDELAKAAGYDLQEKAAPPSGASQTPAEKARSDARAATADWSQAQLQRPDASLESPPEAARALLQERSKSLAMLEESLLAGPRPEWGFDVNHPEAGRDSRGWWNYMQLQKALIARALLATSETRQAAGARTLEASWILDEAVRKRPDVMAVFLGIGVSRLQVGALRKVDVEEMVWRQPLEALKPRGAMVDAFALSQLSTLKRRRGGSSESLGMTETNGAPSRIAALIARPWNRLAEADYSEAVCTELARLRDAPLSDTPSAVPPLGRTHTVRALIAMANPNTRNSFLRGDRLVVDAELTSKVLEAKRLRKANGGRWPVEIPGIETSALRNARWIYTVTPDGHASIELSRKLDWGQTVGLVLPTRWTSAD